MSAKKPKPSKRKPQPEEEGPEPKSGKPKGDGGEQPEEVEETGWDRTKANVRTIGGAVFLAILIRIAVFEAFEIEGPSMEPTLLNGDRVVVAKFRYGLYLPNQDQATFTWGSPNRGDVVIVNSPEGVAIVKRVIGLPGDEVEIRNDVVHINGDPIDVEDLGDCAEDHQNEPDETCHWFRERFGDRSWRISRNTATPATNHPRVTVPDGHVYILGDHRDRSNDSRFFGAVETSKIKGQALAIYWSSDGGWSGEDAYIVRWGRMFGGVE